MRTISNRDQVKNALEKHGPINAHQIFQACDCFDDQKDCNALLHTMTTAREIKSFRALGQQFMQYALNSQEFAAPVARAAAAPAPVVSQVAEVAARAESAHAAAGEALGKIGKSVPFGGVANNATAAKNPRNQRGEGIAMTCLRTLAAAEYPMNCPELAEAAGYSVGGVRNWMRLAAAQGQVERLGFGVLTRFAVPDTPALMRWNDEVRQKHEAVEVQARAAVTAQGADATPAPDALRPREAASAPAESIIDKPGRRNEGEGGPAKVLLALGAVYPQAMGVGPMHRACGLSHSYLGRILRDFMAKGTVKRSGRGSLTAYALALPPPDRFFMKPETSTATLSRPVDSAPVLIAQQARGEAPIEVIDIDRVHHLRDATLTNRLEVDQAISSAIETMRGHFSPEELRGFLRGNIFMAVLVGTPEDLRRQKLYGRVLAEVVQ